MSTSNHPQRPDQRRRSFPSDMGFYPFSGKFAENIPLKTPWLPDYFLERDTLDFEYGKVGGTAPQSELRSVLHRLGADASERMDRRRGSMLGLAIGDALGAPVKLQPREACRVSDFGEGGPFALKAGMWTDETSMACCLAYSLVSRKKFDPKHQLESYSYWYRYGAYSPTGRAFDIGDTFRRAIDRFLATGEPYPGPNAPNTAGSGSIARLAPVVLFYDDDLLAAVENAALSSRTTHQAVEALDACRYFAALLFGALKGTSKDVLLAESFSPEPGYWEREPLSPRIRDIARGSYKSKQEGEIRSTGYVVDALEAALWCFHRNNDFVAGALAAVNLGGQTDTIGAIFGQLAGAYYGETQIPFRWISRVYQPQGFYHFAEDLNAGH